MTKTIPHHMSCKTKLDASKRVLHILAWLLRFPMQTVSYLRYHQA